MAGLGGLNGVGHLVDVDDDDESANVETNEEIEEYDISQDMSESAKGMGGAAYEGSQRSTVRKRCHRLTRSVQYE
jgi:hypothetical protein